MTNDVHFISQSKKDALELELADLKANKIPGLALRIDEARQLGDLSENAEYHAAREDMGWAKGRVQEIDIILRNAEIIDESAGGDIVRIGSSITVKINGNTRQFSIVGAQEADPLSGKISNESPLGKAFLGSKKKSKVQVEVPAGVQVYEIVDIT